MSLSSKSLIILASSAFILVVALYFGVNNSVDPEIEYPKDFEMLLLPDQEQTNLPDIYYIILDEYAGADSLEKNFNFDNIEFISELSQRGFFITKLFSRNISIGCKLVESIPISSLKKFRYCMLRVDGIDKRVKG